MDSRRVLFFLQFLNRNTQGHTAELANMFQRALDENDDVAMLKMLAGGCSFYGEIGGSLQRTAMELLDEVYRDPMRSLDLLPQIRMTHERIRQAERLCDEMMKSPEPIRNSIIILAKKDIPTYLETLRQTASVCIQLLLTYAGPDSVRNLTWEDAAGIQEMIYAVNTKYLPELCSARKPRRYWMIRRRKPGCEMMPGEEVFSLSYEDIRDTDVLCSTLHTEPMGTHALLNIGAFETQQCDVPLCWGLGNLVSTSPEQALGILQKQLVTKLRVPRSDELMHPMPTPRECARILSDGYHYCISPDELVLAMNRWQAGYEIEMRRREHRCLLCGNPLRGKKIICKTHLNRKR